MIKHVFECYLQSSNNERCCCLRIAKELPAFIPVGVNIVMGGRSGGGLHVIDAEYSIDDGFYLVSVGSEYETSDMQVCEFARNLISFGWELHSEDYEKGVAPLMDAIKAMKESQ